MDVEQERSFDANFLPNIEHDGIAPRIRERNRKKEKASLAITCSDSFRQPSTVQPAAAECMRSLSAR